MDRPQTPPPPAGSRVAKTELDLPAALAGDLDAAFERLVRAEADRVFSIACRLLGDHRDAEEVTQDAFLRAYRALGSYDRERIAGLALRPWLAAITVNLARNRRRRGGRAAAGRGPTALRDDPADPDGEPVDPDPAASPPDVVLRREGAEELAGLLAALPLRYRIPIVLRYVAGLTPAEVATALARPEGTVRAQIHRGLVRLRAAVAGSGATGTATPRTPPRSRGPGSPRRPPSTRPSEMDR